jgi:hypothetical protein
MKMHIKLSRAPELRHPSWRQGFKKGLAWSPAGP